MGGGGTNALSGGPRRRLRQARERANPLWDGARRAYALSSWLSESEAGIDAENGKVRCGCAAAAQ